MNFKPALDLNIQERLFSQSEGNAWFERNRDALKKKTSSDLVISLMATYGIAPGRVLEVGCANGYRLNEIALRFQSEVYGIDASQEAIDAGKKDFPSVQLSHCVASNLTFQDASFDLVIVNFVLHWIDRSLLIKTVAEIDRVLKNGGLLIIGDFWPQHASKVRYHHYTPSEIFTFKQDYAQFFVKSGIYSPLAQQIFDSAVPSENGFTIPTSDRDRCSLALLKKDLTGLYETRT